MYWWADRLRLQRRRGRFLPNKRDFHAVQNPGGADGLPPLGRNCRC
jgi:hypothetical protein